MAKTRIPTIQQVTAMRISGTLAIILKTVTVAFATLALYFQDLTLIFADALHHETSIHIFAIPILFVYLIYRKRRMLRAATSFERQSSKPRYFETLSGFLLCTIAVTLYWYGSYTFTPLEYHMFTLPVFAAGLILLLFNKQTLRQMIFLLVFLVFLMPPPVEILYSAGSALSVISSEASNALVTLMGVTSTISSNYGNPVIAIAGLDGTPYRFTVDIACSGVYSLIGFVLFAVFIAYINRDRMWKKAAILFVGVPLIILLNIIRITIILMIGYNYGGQLALQIFHLVGASVLMFIGTFLLLIITEKAFRKRRPPEPCRQCSSDTQNVVEALCQDCGRLLRYPRARLVKIDIIKIAAISIALIFLLLIQVPVFALTEGPAQIIIQTPTGEEGNTEILPQIPGYTLHFIRRDLSFEKLVKQDAALIYTYSKTGALIWVTVEIAQSIYSLHRWEICLITTPLSQGYEPKVEPLDTKDIQIRENPPIIARYFAFQYTNTNQTQAVLYWYETSIFSTNDTSSQKHVKISVFTHPETVEDLPLAEEQLVPIAIAIAEYWQPVKTWTQIALTISQNGLTLTTLFAALLAIVLIYRAYLNSRERISLSRMLTKLPEKDKLLVKAVYNASKRAKSIFSEIEAQWKELGGGQTRTPILLAAALEQIEKAGLIRREIGNLEDKPVIVWKSQLFASALRL